MWANLTGAPVLDVRRIGERGDLDAESARSSVQNYRKKLHRVKGRVDELDEAVEESRHVGGGGHAAGVAVAAVAAERGALKGDG